jgi:hypothetical protein
MLKMKMATREENSTKCPFLFILNPLFLLTIVSKKWTGRDHANHGEREEDLI